MAFAHGKMAMGISGDRRTACKAVPEKGYDWVIKGFRPGPVKETQQACDSLLFLSVGEEGG